MIALCEDKFNCVSPWSVLRSVGLRLLDQTGQRREACSGEGRSKPVTLYSPIWILICLMSGKNRCRYPNQTFKH